MLGRQRPAGFSLEGREWRLAGPSKTSHSGAAATPNRRGLQFPEVEGAGVAAETAQAPVRSSLAQTFPGMPPRCPQHAASPWSGSRHHRALEAPP